MNNLARAFARALALVVCLIVATGAAQSQDAADDLFPEEIRAEFDRVHQSVINRDISILAQRWDPAGTHDEMWQSLTDLLGFLPEGQFISRELAGAKIFSMNSLIKDNDRTTFTENHEYRFEGGLAFVGAKIRVEDNQIWLDNLTIYRLKQSLRLTHAFSLKDKSALHYLLFAAAVTIPTFIIFTFIAAFRTKGIVRRKRWLAFILFGFFNFTINWTTGAWGISPGSFSLLGAGYSYASELAPVMLKAGLPLGALLFWFYKRTGRLGLKPKDQPEDSPQDAAVVEVQD